ncbi:MAG: hypothetical protein AAF789_07955, partial [Bacteroidota bacterium]
MSNYNSYHSNLIFLHQFNLLPPEVKARIPRSTLSNWKTKDISQIIGCEKFSNDDFALLEQIAKNRKLMRLARCLNVLFELVTQILQSAKNKNELLRARKHAIVDAIQKVRHTLGMKRAFRLLGIAPSKFYYWLEIRKCQLSTLQLCKSRHPGQLLSSEVDIIKKYLADVRFKNWSTLSIYYQALRENAVFMSVTTWYKYATRLGIQRKFFKLKTTRETGLRTTRPLELLQMDVTIFKSMDHMREYT